MGRILVTIVDTDILIDAGRGVQQAIDCIADIDAASGVSISVVTLMELMVGCRSKSESKKLEKFVQPFRVVHANDSISEKAVELLRAYRLSHGLLIADSLIAATALTLDAPFITKNQRDFQFIAGLNLLPYP